MLKKEMILFLIFLTFIQCKAPQGTEFESTFQSFDKTKIAFTDEGKGPAVILIHGFINDGSAWNNSEVKKRLLQEGYRVIVPDMRGNGRSEKPKNPEAYQNNAEVKDLVALANYLKLKEYSAVGYSRGSILLAKLLSQKNRISKAVIGGMGIDFTNPQWERRIAFADAFSGRADPTEMTEGALTYARSINADLKILGFLQDYQPVTSIAELKNIKTKTLVIAGNLDKDNGDPEKLHELLPHSKFMIVKGDHNNTYKQNNFAEAVVDFLSH